MESHKNLVDQCVQGEGLVQVNVQIQTHLKRINIADVLKPAEDYVDESSITDSLDAESSTSANINLSDDIITAATTTASFQTQQSNENNNSENGDKPQNVIKWLVDPQFRFVVKNACFARLDHINVVILDGIKKDCGSRKIHMLGLLNMLAIGCNGQFVILNCRILS